MSRSGAAVAGLAVIVSFLLGLVVAGTRPPQPESTFAGPASIGRSDVPMSVSTAAAVTGSGPGVPAPAGAVDFAAVAARLNPAVVNVDTAARASEGQPRSRRYSSGDDAAREGSGSGFLIDPNGFLLTNHHVVNGADRVTVTLSDGRSFRADIIGVDPALDVALLQIHARDRLPVATLGDSNALRVGEWVCAIGNPLGIYAHSVTVGVVSFLGRKLFDPNLDAFIQTDAAISFGNSGGPLINARGEVVGITTAISEQASNIGFAIPISQVVSVLAQLRAHGGVARGFLGVTMTDLTPALRRSLRLAPDAGALIQDIEPDTPAAHAGLRTYDVITSADGQAVESHEALDRYIAARQPGTLTALGIWRDGGTQTVRVKLRERPLARVVQRRTSHATDVRPAAQAPMPLGLSVHDLDAPTAERLGIPDSIQGVLVSDVDPAGPARLAQLRPNQVILEINRQRITSEVEYLTAVATLKAGEAAALLVYDRVDAHRFICTVVPDPQP
jgi:serine protease Do